MKHVFKLEGHHILALGAKEGSELVLSADGEGDKHSVEKLEAFLAILEG